MSMKFALDLKTKKQAPSYSREELIIVRDMAGKYAVEEIVKRLRKECKTKRTIASVRRMALNHGYPLKLIAS